MLLDSIFSHKMTSLVLAAWMVHLPLLLVQPHPDDVVVAISPDGKHMCLTNFETMNRTKQIVPKNCRVVFVCGDDVVESYPCGSNQPCADFPGSDREPACPSSASCCVFFQLNSQTLFFSALAETETNPPLLGMMIPGDEAANFLNFKPPIPPPKNC